MDEKLKEQIELLHNDPQYMELLEIEKDSEGSEKNLAESYILEHSPFVEIEPEN